MSASPTHSATASSGAESPPALLIHLNGEERQVAAGATISDLLAELGLETDRVAVELDCAIVRRPQWPRTPLAAGARLEIVHFVGGG